MQKHMIQILLSCTEHTEVAGPTKSLIFYLPSPDHWPSENVNSYKSLLQPNQRRKFPITLKAASINQNKLRIAGKDPWRLHLNHPIKGLSERFQRESKSTSPTSIIMSVKTQFPSAEQTRFHGSDFYPFVFSFPLQRLLIRTRNQLVSVIFKLNFDDSSFFEKKKGCSHSYSLG